MIIFVKVLPKTSKRQLVSFQDGILKIKLTSAPEKGKANTELIQFLAQIFNISQSQIKILSGQYGNLKKIVLSSIDENRFLEKIQKNLP